MKPATRLPLILLFLLIGLLPSTTAQARPADISDVEEYLQEVYDHLRESYAFSEDISTRDLLKSGKKGVLRALTSERSSLKQLPEPVRSDLIRSLRGRTITSLSEFTRLLHSVRQTPDTERKYALKLADVMVDGMIRGTNDPFSRLLTMQDLRKLRKRLLGEGTSRSLGVHVREEDGVHRINYVQYRSAAYRAGLTSGDVIVDVNGTPLKGTTRETRSALLKADYGQNVRMTIYREEWDHPHTVRLTQASPGVNTVESALLPDDVGYVRLTRFGLNAASQLKRELKELKRQGMRTLLLDLRNNPGGALPAAVDVADLFLSGNRVITTTRSNFELDNVLLRIVRNLLGFEPLSGTRRAETASPFETIDMAVLVNGSTASASELTAGALQDHDRATIIGRQTYGKGVGQVAIPLTSTSGLGDPPDVGFLQGWIPTRFLYLTVMTYRLPTGRSIHETGITPDRFVSDRQDLNRKPEVILKLRSSAPLQSYVRNQVLQREKRMRELARYDGFEADRYPNVQELYDTVRRQVDPELEPSTFRRELRKAIRDFFQIYRSVKFTVDLQADPVLQAGILHLTED